MVCSLFRNHTGREYAHVGTSPSSSTLSPWELELTESSTRRTSLLSEKLSDRPAKKPRSELLTKKRKSLPYEDDPSSATLVDEPLTTEIPFIDLCKVASKKTKRKSATRLRISRISEAKQLHPANPRYEPCFFGISMPLTSEQCIAVRLRSWISPPHIYGGCPVCVAGYHH